MSEEHTNIVEGYYTETLKCVQSKLGHDSFRELDFDDLIHEGDVVVVAHKVSHVYVVSDPRFECSMVNDCFIGKPYTEGMWPIFRDMRRKKK